MARGLLSSYGVQAPERAGSVVVARGLSSCAAWALECVGLVARGMWDLSSPTRDPTRVPCIGRRILKHCTTREVPIN